MNDKQYRISRIVYSLGSKIVTRDTVEGDELIRRDIEMSTPQECPEIVVEDFDWKCTGGRW